MENHCEFYTEKSLAFDGSPQEFDVLLDKCSELLKNDFQKKAIEYTNEWYFGEGKKFEPAKIKALIPPRTTTKLTTEPSTPTIILTTELTAEPSTPKMIPAKNTSGLKSMLVGLLLVFISIGIQQE